MCARGCACRVRGTVPRACVLSGAERRSLWCARCFGVNCELAVRRLTDTLIGKCNMIKTPAFETSITSVRSRLPELTFTIW